MFPPPAPYEILKYSALFVLKEKRYWTYLRDTRLLLSGPRFGVRSLPSLCGHRSRKVGKLNTVLTLVAFLGFFFSALAKSLALGILCTYLALNLLFLKPATVWKVATKLVDGACWLSANARQVINRRGGRFNSDNGEKKVAMTQCSSDHSLLERYALDR